MLQVREVDRRSSELSEKPLHRICYAETARDLQLAPSGLAYGYVEAAETALKKKLTGEKDQAGLLIGGCYMDWLPFFCWRKASQ